MPCDGWFLLSRQSCKVTFKRWSQAAKKCTHEKAPQAKIVLFGVDSEEDYKEARDLGAYGVMSNRPLALRLATPLVP